MKKFAAVGFASSLLVLFALYESEAQEIRFQFTNPSFGGNAFNSPHLLGLADRQNQHQDDGSDALGLVTESLSEQFARSLEARLLSALAGQVTDAIFGEDPQERGVVEFGDQTITFFRGLETINLTIADGAAGTTTEITVPVLQVQ